MEGKIGLVAEVVAALEKGGTTKMLLRDESREWRLQDVTTLGRFSRIEIARKIEKK